jgi:hypothetical protein
MYGETRNAYRGLIGRCKAKRPLGRYWHRWQDNVKKNHKGVMEGCEED